MSRAIFSSALHLRRVSLFWFSFGIAVYGWLMVAFFPLIEENIEYLQAIESILTDEMMALFGRQGLEFGTLGGFLSLEYLGLIWVFIVGAAVITFAAGALGGAVDDGTMELTLSQPVSRTQVALTRYLALAAYAGALNLVTVVTLYVPGLIHDVEVPLDAMALLFANGWLVTMAIGGVAYALSAASSGGGRTIGVSLGLLIGMWLMDVLGALSERFAWLRELTLFYYWNPEDAIDALRVPAESWAVFAVAAALSFVVAIWLFRRRDVV